MAEFKGIKYVEDADVGRGTDRIDGRVLKRKSVGADKTTGVTDIADDSITKAMLQNDVAGKNEVDYEQVSIVISNTDTTGTAAVTSGSIPVSYFLSSFTTPAASYIQLAVSGTTLTATLSTAPGASNSITIQVVLLKA